MKKILIILVLILLSTSVLGTTLDDLKYLNVETCEELQEQLDIVGQEVPDAMPFQNELVNLKIEELNLTSNIQIKQGKVVGVECGASNESTYDLAVQNLSTINDVILDEDPLDAYLEMKESGAIKMEATGFGKKVKLFFANVLATVANWFV
ncbi:hypothetical protein K9M74_04365 [Candidatus Woesearchaeota archaeon]|nr:hypothetical protein [Candidatus Woesearchaeota archaeon]